MESYPPDPVTNYGIELLTDGIEPQITYVSPDGELIFYLNGGLAPMPGVTEGVNLAEGISGLYPPFNQLSLKGARQDGQTWTDTVYDACAISMKVTASARSRDRLRTVISKWMGAWDPKNPGILSWVTPDMGQWWCTARLAQRPPEPLTYQPGVREQTFTWLFHNSKAFWRGADSRSQFQFAYTDSIDTFDNRADTASLGPTWQQTYSPSATGTCGVANNVCVWTPSGTTSASVVNRWLGTDAVQTVSVYGSPTTWTLTYNGQTTSGIAGGATAAAVQSALEALLDIGSGNVTVTGLNGGPYTVTFTGALGTQLVKPLTGAITAGGTNPYVTVAQTTQGMSPTTDTDNQVIKAQFGVFYTWPFNDGAYVDLWGRMNNNDASPTGIRVRIAVGSITLSRFINGVETVMDTVWMGLSPFPWDTYTFICGTATNSRQYKLLVNGFPLLDFTEADNGSMIGASYRGGGFGMTAGVQENIELQYSQAPPPTVDNWQMADNITITQSGHLPLTNFGTETEWPDFLVYGPGTFVFGDGPGVEPTISFGPLADGQIALLRTNPNFRGVYDLSSEPSQQTLTGFQSFVQSLFSLAFNNNIPPLVSWFESLFGITPQQGNLYSLLNGRWTNGIDPKPMSGPPTTAQIAVQITDGDASSKIIAAITPRRPWPE